MKQTHSNLKSGLDDQLHLNLLTQVFGCKINRSLILACKLQLPKEVLARLEVEVPSLAGIISLARSKQEALNKNIESRQQLHHM